VRFCHGNLVILWLFASKLRVNGHGSHLCRRIPRDSTRLRECKPPPKHLISTEIIWDLNPDFWINPDSDLDVYIINSLTTQAYSYFDRLQRLIKWPTIETWVWVRKILLNKNTVTAIKSWPALPLHKPKPIVGCADTEGESISLRQGVTGRSHVPENGVVAPPHAASLGIWMPQQNQQCQLPNSVLWVYLA